MGSKNIKAGAFFSYCLIIINALYGLLFIPFLIRRLGNGEYGVYKIIASLSSSISILDFGIGSTVLRYISKFAAENDQDEINNFAAMSYILAFFLAVFVLVIGIVVYCFIEKVYNNSLSFQELQKAKQLFLLYIVVMGVGIFEKVAYGIVAGFQRFAFSNGMRVFILVLKIVVSYALLLKCADSKMLLYVDIGVLLVSLAVYQLYIGFILNVRISLKRWDSSLFKESMIYSLLMFIQSLVVQFNGNLDNMVIGAIIGTSAVTIYSVGLQFYSMYEHFAMAFSDLMLPSISRLVVNGATNKDLEDAVIKVGRLEFMVLGGALGAYLVIGKEFIQLWLGDSYLFAWRVGLILMVPTTVPLIQNVCLSILRAKNRIAFRTIVVCIMAVVNLVITIIGVRVFGSIAACIGTAVGIIGANIIAMNVYYVKVLKINIKRIFKNVLRRSLICCFVSSLVLVLENSITSTNSWLSWGCKAFSYIILYGILLWFFSLNQDEKKMMFGRFRRGVYK